MIFQRIIIVVGLFCLFANVCVTQQTLCEGRLGNNIFENGSIGTGIDPVAPDPMIKTSYMYVPYAPDDGMYSKAHSTDDLNPYDTWLRIGDAGGDPNGYILVFNASYDPGIFYEEEITGLCPNTLYEFSAEVINLIKKDVDGHIDPNISFYLDTIEEYTTGVIGKSEMWNKYGFSFTTGPSQNSITLRLANNAPGGAGNDLALDNISFRPCVPENGLAITDIDGVYSCPQDTAISIIATFPDTWFIRWQTSTDSMNWTDVDASNKSQTIKFEDFSQGSHFYRYLVAQFQADINNPKCNITSETVSVLVEQKAVEIYDTICSAKPYVFGNKQLTTSGIYLDTLFSNSASSCDTILNLHLTVGDSSSIDIIADVQQAQCFADKSFIEDITVQGDFPPFTYDVKGLLNIQVTETDLRPGLYKITALDRLGCSATYQFEVIQPEPFLISINADTSVYFGESAKLWVASNQDNIDIMWKGMDLSCLDCNNPIAFPQNDRKYEVTITSADGCMLDAFTNVTILKRETKNLFPNIISVHGDPDNASFVPDVSSILGATLKELSIYDRYGNLVHHSFDAEIEKGWDGRFNNREVESGVYTFSMLVVYESGLVETIFGSVTVVK